MHAYQVNNVKQELEDLLFAADSKKWNGKYGNEEEDSVASPGNNEEKTEAQKHLGKSERKKTKKDDGQDDNDTEVAGS